MLKEIFISMRPQQWYKNLVIFIGIAFSLNLLNFHLWIATISAFIIFCLFSGGIYIINDVLDIEKDRKHPKRVNDHYHQANLFPILLFCLQVSLSW